VSEAKLVGALVEARSAVDELEDEDAAAARALRGRIDALDRAAAGVALRRSRPEQLLQLAVLAGEVRDAAIDLRRDDRSVARLVSTMMD
jgi:hypothetical protein